MPDAVEPKKMPESSLTGDYKFGFVTDVEVDEAPKGLNEEIIRLISRKKGEPECMVEWRLKAYRHWLTMTEPHWPNFHYDPIDYQDIRYYSAPKKKGDGPKSMAEVDQEVVKTFEKLGIPLSEQKRLAGVAVDATDRGGPDCDDPVYQARGQGLDPDLPRQADHQEAGRDPHGEGQGGAGRLGGGDQAWPDPLRDGRRDGGGRARGVPARGAQAADRDQVREADGGSGMKAADLRDLSVEELEKRAAELAQEVFNLRFQHATGQLENTQRIPLARRDLARVKTVLTEKGVPSARTARPVKAGRTA